MPEQDKKIRLEEEDDDNEDDDDDSYVMTLRFLNGDNKQSLNTTENEIEN